MLSVVLAFLVNAPAAQTSAGQLTVAVPGLSLVDVTPAKGDMFADYFAAELSKSGPFKVITRSQMSQMIGYENQKQLLGCSETSTSCMAELAGAFGTELILIGSLGKAGTRWTVVLKLMDPSTGKEVAQASDRVADEDAMFDWLAQHAKSMGVVALKAKRPELVTAAPLETSQSAQPANARKYVWVPLVAAGVFAGASTYLFVDSQLSKEQFDRNPNDVTDAAVYAAQTKQTLAWVFVGGAVAGLGTAAVMYFVGAPEGAPQVSVVPLRDGAALSLTGEF